MGTKLSSSVTKRVKSLGINVKTEEEARKELIKILVKNGIDGMEEEDMDTLIEIAESFVEGGETEGSKTEEEENDDLASEVEEEDAKKPAKKTSKKVVEEEEEEDSEEEEESEEESKDEYDAMDRSDLKKYIKKN